VFIEVSPFVLKWLFAHMPHIKCVRLGRAFKLPTIKNALRAFKSPCIYGNGRIATTFYFTKWLFTRCPIHYVLDWFPWVQVTSHLKCIRLVSVCPSLPCSVEPTYNGFQGTEKKSIISGIPLYPGMALQGTAMHVGVVWRHETSRNVGFIHLRH